MLAEVIRQHKHLVQLHAARACGQPVSCCATSLMVSMRPVRSVVMTASPMDASVTSMRSFPPVAAAAPAGARELRAQVVLALLQLVHQRLHALRHVVEG
jgi:hypothetical protein